MYKPLDSGLRRNDGARGFFPFSLGGYGRQSDGAEGGMGLAVGSAWGIAGPACCGQGLAWIVLLRLMGRGQAGMTGLLKSGFGPRRHSGLPAAGRDVADRHGLRGCG